jgi:hypothetical protein
MSAVRIPVAKLLSKVFAALLFAPERAADTLHTPGFVMEIVMMRIVMLMRIVVQPLAMIAAAFTCVLACAGRLDGSQPLTLQVSPSVVPAPAFVRVRAVIEASAENRSLEIVAQSSEFYRSSRIDLDGQNAPPLAVFEYPNLPAGMYEISAVLAGAGGRRVTASRFVKVVPGVGSGR